jgi:catechol 2,3-dioxygenase-like lactoylglutathione lyase family enzyme
MPVTGINHVNIRTTDVAKSASFYVEVFDFEYRRGPGVVGNQSNWLFDREGNPIIHLRLRAAESNSTGPIDHVALNCQGKAEILSRLEARKIEFNVFENAGSGLTQVFLKDPHGIALELNFTGE